LARTRTTSFQLIEEYAAAVNMTPGALCVPDLSIATISSKAKPQDKLFVVTAGTLCLDTMVDNGTFRVTGGTGAYRDARGGGTFQTRVTAFGATVLSESTYTGTITR
jgi:hypothetical protein